MQACRNRGRGNPPLYFGSCVNPFSNRGADLLDYAHYITAAPPPYCQTFLRFWLVGAYTGFQAVPKLRQIIPPTITFFYSLSTLLVQVFRQPKKYPLPI